MNFSVQNKSYEPGEQIAGYTVLSRIGGGGFGELYLVKDVTGAAYALKILQNRAEREFAALQKMREIPPFPGLTAIHAAGHLPDGKLYYLMDAADNLLHDGAYLPDTLANRLARQGTLPVPEVLQLAAALLPAVQHLHAHGMAHCDIKPENIVFIRNTPMLADFGSLDRCGRTDGIPAVTSGFYPPEELSGTVNGPFSAKNDLYALGMTLYCAWSGHAPEDYPLLPDDAAPDGIRVLRKLLQRACNPAPACRFQNADGFLRAVRKAEQKLHSHGHFSPKILCGAAFLLFGTVLSGLLLFQARQRTFQQQWKIVEAKVRLAEMAEESGILPGLKLAGASPESTAPFQALHDLLQEYEKWRNAPETERRKQTEKIMILAERCPKGYRDPLIPLQGYFLEQRELSAEERELLRKTEAVCGNAYRQLKREITAMRKNPSVNPAERDKKERQLLELKKQYASETAYMESCMKLRSAGEIRDIIKLRQKLERLKISLRQSAENGRKRAN